MSFKRLDPEDLLLSSDSITSTLWTGYVPTLTTFYTSAIQEQTEAGAYYLNVYNTESLLSNAEIQFDIAYGDKAGSGSYFYDSAVTGSSPSRTIYGQYRSLTLGDENANFVFGNVTQSNFHVISLERNRYKESLFPGSLRLRLTSGSNSILLIDDSQYTSTNVFTDSGRVYNLISGSASGIKYSALNANGFSFNSGSYGYFLPDISTLILNSSALATTVAGGGILLSVSQSFNSPGLNNRKLLTAIQSGASFSLNSQETLTSDFVFIRARNSEFNYSENPSFISGSNGSVLYDSFINSPQTFITTVGLYNDNNELLAVAKLSKPLKKDFTKEMLLRVKLDF